jgi:transcriptional regulator with XRE-family HTH domain
MAAVHKIRQVQLVGRKIRQLRKEHNLTQTELSARIGIQQSDLSRMEKGEYRVSLDTLFRILAEFEVTMAQFFDDQAPEQAATLPARDLQLLTELHQLDQESLREVEDFVAFKRAQQPRLATRDGH